MPRPDLDLNIPPLLTASVLLAARQFALASGISWPGTEDILAATGVSPEEAHQIEDTILDQLAALAVMANRLSPPPDCASWDHGADLTVLADEELRAVEQQHIAVEVLRFLKHNPGCAQSGTRERYTDSFRRFVLELRWRYAGVTTAEFAVAIDVPLDTVEDWLCGGRRRVDASTLAKYPRATRGARARLA